MADDGEFITSFDECSPEMIQAIRSYFRLWGEHHMKNPDPLINAQLEEHVDNLVFKTWASDEPITTPVFQVPKIRDSYVRVGVFKKTLPPKDITQAIITEGFEDAIIGPRLRYIDKCPPAERKSGRPAFLRAKMDSLQQSIVHEFFDKEEQPALISHIDFGTTDNKLSGSKLSQAYNTADTAWARACDTWNSLLCVYLCRRKIYDLSHTKTWYPAHGERDLTDENFVLAPRICTKIPWILDQHRQLGVFIDDKEIRGPEGCSVFTGPVSRGIDTYPDNPSTSVKKEH